MGWSSKWISTILLFVLISASCDETNKTEDTSKPEEVGAGVMAIVITDYAGEGCEVLLEITEEGKPVLLMPINLEDSFKINGKKVIIEFHSSRIMQGNCQKGRPIVIDSIKLVD